MAMMKRLIAKCYEVIGMALDLTDFRVCKNPSLWSFQLILRPVVDQLDALNCSNIYQFLK